MKQNWVLIGAVLAILAVPFGLALFEDATRETDAAAVDGEDWDGVEPEAEPDFELPEPASDAVVEWERAEADIDTGAILAYLAGDEPRAAGILATAAVFGTPPADVTRNLEARFNAKHGPDITLAIEPGAHLHAIAPIASATFTTPPAPVLDRHLRARWGSPDVESSTCAVWEAPSVGHRAALLMNPGRWQLMLSEYRSLDALLATNGDVFGFEPDDLIGASIDSIESRHRESLVADDSGDPTYTLLVIPAEASRHPTLPIDLIAPAGRVTEISATIDLGCDRLAASRARVLLEEHLGPIRDTAQLGEATELGFRDRPDVSAFVYSDRLVVIRRRR